MHYIKKYVPNLDFNIASFIYLSSALIIMNFPLLLQDRIPSILSLLISITFLFCAYQNKKTSVDKTIQNNIVKWVTTVLIFSACMWYSKHKLNFDYEIQPEFLNYSSYGYAFAIAIPFSLFIYGLCIFLYLYLRRVTAYQAFYAAIIAVPICLIIKDLIDSYRGIYFIVVMGIVIAIPIGIITLLKQEKGNDDKDKKNLFSLLKIIIFDINRAKIIFNIWIKKILKASNRCLRVIDLLSIAIALSFIGLFAIKIIPEHQQSFLLLDAFPKTDCNPKKDSFLYIRKSNNECYRIESKGLEIIKMTEFSSLVE